VKVEVGEGEPLALELAAFLRSLRGDGAGAASGDAGPRRAARGGGSAGGDEATDAAVDDAAQRRFLIVAGEPSGDAHAALLTRELQARGPCRVRGVAGPAMRAAGVEPVVAMESLAVMGFAEIVTHLPALFGARARLLESARASLRTRWCWSITPASTCGSGPVLKRRGARVFYYIAPQVWAWHPERAAEMARWVDRLAVVFPFEEEIFRAAGVDTRFVGHPLLDALAPEVDAPALRAELGLAPGVPLLGLLPGSRAQEVRHLLEPLCRAAALLRRDRPALAAVVAAAAGLDDAHYAAAARHGVRVVRGRTHAIQRHATACAVASGTATLETALFGTPLTVVYRVGRLNYAIARRVVRLPHIGLPNIVAGTQVAPELVQDALTPERLAASLAPCLDDPRERAARSAALAVVRAASAAPGLPARGRAAVALAA
jgi:lipid-A-disaccharide synthase